MSPIEWASHVAHHAQAPMPAETALWVIVSIFLVAAAFLLGSRTFR